MPLTIRQLIDQGAFKLPGDDKVYTGKKETQIVAVNARTGKVLNQYGSPFASFMQPRCRVSKDSLDELDDECDASAEDQDTLLIGKTSMNMRMLC